MRCESAISNLRPPARRRAGSRAFTLIELMVVMVIIGILASIAVPAMKGLGQANRSAAAHRQILDDIGLARLRAINDRAPVYVVFVPPSIVQSAFAPPRTGAEMRQLTNLLAAQYTGYAIISTRTVGDQPGHPTPRYLTEWRTLPEGLLFPPYKFGSYKPNANEYERALQYQLFPFPNSRSRLYALPCIGFNAQGQLINGRDEVVTLAKGSVFASRTATGLAIAPADVQLTPQVNNAAPPATQTNTYQFVRVNWLTGRARVELPEFR